MNAHAARIETGAGVSFFASVVLHLTVVLLLAWWGRLLPEQVAIQETYYVDMVTLPTAAPEAGSPAQSPVEAQPPAPMPAPAPRPPTPLPARPASAAGAISSKPAAVPQENAASDSEFTERMAKMDEARREAAVLEKLRRQVKAVTNTKAATPAASGDEQGVRYADFIKSRLEDALKVTSSYDPKKSPEVVVRMTISAEGKLVERIVIRSNDATFQMAVERAIDLASEKFTPPPTRTAFKSGFVFRPKGITR